MNVYAMKVIGRYGGGMAIVAAETEEQAKNLAKGIDRQWFTPYERPQEVEVLPLMSTVEYPCVITHFETGE